MSETTPPRRPPPKPGPKPGRPTTPGGPIAQGSGASVDDAGTPKPPSPSPSQTRVDRPSTLPPTLRPKPAAAAIEAAGFTSSPLRKPGVDLSDEKRDDAAGDHNPTEDAALPPTMRVAQEETAAKLKSALYQWRTDTSHGASDSEDQRGPPDTVRLSVVRRFPSGDGSAGTLPPPPPPPPNYAVRETPDEHTDERHGGDVESTIEDILDVRVPKSIIMQRDGRDCYVLLVSVTGRNAVGEQESWESQKMYSDFVNLDTSLKRQFSETVRKEYQLPERKIFASNAPAVNDQRKVRTFVRLNARPNSPTLRWSLRPIFEPFSRTCRNGCRCEHSFAVT